MERLAHAAAVGEGPAQAEPLQETAGRTRIEDGGAPALRAASTEEFAFEPGEESVVAPGLAATVRHLDTDETRRIRISGDENDPARGLVHTSSPIVRALYGCGVEDEAELVTVGGSRTVIVIDVFDPAQMAAE